MKDPAESKPLDTSKPPYSAIAAQMTAMRDQKNIQVNVTAKSVSPPHDLSEVSTTRPS